MEWDRNEERRCRRGWFYERLSKEKGGEGQQISVGNGNLATPRVMQFSEELLRDPELA